MDTEARRVFDRMRLEVIMEQHPEWTVTEYASKLGRSRAFVYKSRDRINDPRNQTFAEKYMSRS